MSAARRRRVMVDSDEEDNTSKAQHPSPLVTPSPTQAPQQKKRRLAVATMEEDESWVGGGEEGQEQGEAGEGEGEGEDDEAERKRRQQLADRWSKLGEDSDHGNSESSDSDDEAHGGGSRSSILVQLRVQDAWRRTPSKRASRLLTSDANRSGDEDDDDLDDMADFIVSSDGDDAGSKPNPIASESRQKRRGRSSGNVRTGLRSSPQSAGNGKVTSLSRRQTPGRAEKTPSSRRKGSVEVGQGGLAEKRTKHEKAVAMLESSSEEESSSNGPGDDVNGHANGNANGRENVIGENCESGSDESECFNLTTIAKADKARRSGGKQTSKGISTAKVKGKTTVQATLTGKTRQEAKPADRGRKNRTAAAKLGTSEGTCSDVVPVAERKAIVTRSARMELRGKPREAAAASGSSEKAASPGCQMIDLSSDKDENGQQHGDGDGSDVEGSEYEDEEGEEEVVKKTPKGRNTNGRRQTQTGKPSKASKKKPAIDSDDDEANVAAKTACGAGSRRRRRARVNYREMLMDSSSESSNGPDDGHENKVGGGSSVAGAEPGSGNSSWGDADDDEEDSDGGWEDWKQGKGKEKRCGKDREADYDEDFAVDLDDDDDDESEDEEEGNEQTARVAEKTKKGLKGKGKVGKAGGLPRRSGRRKQDKPTQEQLQEESEENEDMDNFLADDDEEDEEGEGDGEGDVFFSHAALFHEQEQSEEGGISSLSVEAMTLYEAFLYYVEYLAKAAAGDGKGAAFMKKYVAQPRLPEHARYGKAKEMVEKKEVKHYRRSLSHFFSHNIETFVAAEPVHATANAKLRHSVVPVYGHVRKTDLYYARELVRHLAAGLPVRADKIRDSILRYPHYGYQHVDMMETVAHCDACNRSNITKVVAFLSGTEYDPTRVWDGLRWDRHLPKDWDDPDVMAASKQEAHATHHLGDTCMHKSHLYHSLVHYKLYLVSKVAAKVRADTSLEPENFRGEGTAQTSTKTKKKCLNFTDNEFESLSGLLDKATELNGVKWGARAGVRGGRGKTFLETGAGSSILEWLSSEAQPGQYGQLDFVGRQSGEEDGEEAEDEEEEFSVGRGRRWQTVGSRGGRYG